MQKITTYPHSFKLHGVEIELNKNMMRRIDAKGIEGKLSLVGDVTGAAFSETCDEWAVAVKYKEGTYVISKKSGWFGPFEAGDDIAFDEKKGISVVAGKLNGKAGKHSLTR